MKTALAIDLGSSSLRGYVGCWDKGELQVREVYRCANSVRKDEDGSLVWDYSALATHVCEAAEAATRQLEGPPDSFAIDGWGVDTVFLNAEGDPVCPVFAYRDRRGAQGRALLAAHLDEERCYALTGISPQDINTVYRLAYAADKGQLPADGQLMFLQDALARHLLSVELPGWAAPVRCQPWAGVGVASTSGLLSRDKAGWCQQVIQAAGIPARIFPPVLAEPALVAKRGDTALVACGSHDTGCAAYGMGLNPGDIFVSLGSWAVVGALSAPVTEAGITNEAAVGGGNRAQLNRVGMWLAQECRRAWQSQGEDVSFARLDDLVARSASAGVLIDPEDPVFSAPGDMPARIRKEICAQAADVEEGIGPLLRVVTESVAASIARAIETIRRHTSASGEVHVGGGGTKDALLLAQLATRLGQKLHVHEGEMSVRGNLLAQLRVQGVSAQELSDFVSRQGRRCVVPSKS